MSRPLTVGRLKRKCKVALQSAPKEGTMFRKIYDRALTGAPLHVEDYNKGVLTNAMVNLSLFYNLDFTRVAKGIYLCKG